LRQIDPATGTLVPVYQQFNFNPYNVFQTPFKRFNMYGAARYEVADGIELYTRGLFSKNTINTIVAPSGVFDEVLNVPSANPYLPTAARNQFCNDVNTPLFDANGASITHDAAGTARCLASATITNPSAAGYTVIGIETLRRTPDVGPRISSYQTTVFDYRAGIRGDISQNLHYDVAGSYGESENTQTILNYVLLSRAQQAVNATNATTCLDTSNGCVPLNIFGGAGTITPAMAKFLTANSTSTNRTTLAQARALISGDLGWSSPWAADPINFAVGGEYRHYTASQSSDLLAQTPGELGGAGGAAPSFTGGYDVYEALAEVGVPIVSDKPFFDSLTINGGIRYSHYTVATPSSPKYNTTTYKGEIAWSPVRDIKFRGTYAHAVRAPNIGELFTPVTTGLTNLTTDPCAGAAPTTNANLAAVCRAQGAPASSIGAIANPNSGQANITGGGNVNVKPEKSNSYTFGTVLQPRFLSGFTATIDYYHIKVTDAITTPTPGDILNACFGNLSAASATSAACTSIRRNPGTGQLSGSPATTAGLPGQLSNLGQLETDGIDLSANYRHDFGLLKLGVALTGNWTNHSRFNANASSATSLNRDCVGYYSVNCASIQPEFQWNMRTTFGFSDVDVSVLWRHINSVTFEPGNGTRFSGTLTGGDLNGQQANFNRIPAYNYIDLALRFGITKNVDLTLGVENLFDKNPPVVGNTIGSTTYNSGNTYPSTYDALGRKYAAGVKLKF
jgi:iron complex outermembrane recepter protein